MLGTEQNISSFKISKVCIGNWVKSAQKLQPFLIAKIKYHVVQKQYETSAFKWKECKARKIK